MNFLYENFIFPLDQSITIRREELEIKKHTTFRTHLNFEIALIENCEGKRLIGDHIDYFMGPELVLLGSYLPHCWQYHNTLDEKSFGKVTVVHFYPDFLGQDFLSKPEAKFINILFNKASKGILFSGKTVVEARVLLNKMLTKTGLSRSVIMLELLNLLAHSNSFRILSSEGYNSKEKLQEVTRINKIYNYIYKNFKEDISLKDVSSIVSMSNAAFCRYFKLKTNRTFSDFLKEIRIGHASKLLIEKRFNVSEACFNSGYNNISNFNKQFKEIKGISPREFMRKYIVVEDD